MLVPVAVLWAATGAGAAPAASFTPEGFLLVYGPLGVLATAGLVLGREYRRTLIDARDDAEERARDAEARMAVAVQREADRADRAEARTGAAYAELAALNAEVRHDVVPALTAVTQTMSHVLVVQQREAR